MKEALDSIFSEYGKIVSIFVKLDKNNKAPFGFVSFENNEAAKRA